MSMWSAAILLFMVLDPFGNLPLFISALGGVPAARRRRVLLREMLIALGLLILCLFIGPYFLRLLQISDAALRVAGGLILFMISIKMVFGGTDQIFKDTPEGEPFIVPLAVPYTAGPSAIATLLLLVGQAPERWPTLLLSLLLAWCGTLAILLAAVRVAAMLGKRGLIAIERLMGLLLTAIAVEMVLRGALSILAPA